MKLYLKTQPYQAQAAEPQIVSSNTDAASMAGVKRIYLKPGAGVKIPTSFPSVSAQTVTPTPAPSVTPSGYGGYMPSLTPAHTRGNGYMGYGLETNTPESTQTSGAWRGLPAYASKAMGYLQEVGQYGRDFSAGMGIEAAMRGQTDSGGSPSAKYRTYLDLEDVFTTG